VLRNFRRSTISANRDKGASAGRYERYKAVVDRLVERTDFALPDLHQACDGERPAFVTRLVNELVESGWLLREDHSPSQNYRWNKGRGEFSAACGGGKATRDRPLSSRPIMAPLGQAQRWPGISVVDKPATSSCRV
jgi:hypothetical protein